MAFLSSLPVVAASAGFSVKSRVASTNWHESGVAERIVSVRPLKKKRVVADSYLAAMREPKKRKAAKGRESYVLGKMC
jgi:hypothetical protein